MTAQTDPWGITFPTLDDPVGWMVFQTLANNVNTNLTALDNLAIASGVLQSNKTLTASNSRVSMLNTSPKITPLNRSSGVYVSSGSLLISAGWSVLLFGCLSGQGFAPGQNVGFDLYYGTSTSSMTTNEAVASGVAGASANGFLNAIVPPVVLPAQTSTRYAFLAARSTDGGGDLKGSREFGNSTVLMAIGIKTS